MPVERGRILASQTVKASMLMLSGWIFIAIPIMDAINMWPDQLVFRHYLYIMRCR